MRTDLIKADLSEEFDGYAAGAEAKVGVFDYLFGAYLIAMVATNYTAYNNLLSSIGMAIPVLFLFTMFVGRYRFQREFYVFIAFYVWVLLGSLLSRYRLLSCFSFFYFIKIQFIMVVVALRCQSMRRIRFYLAVAGIGTACIVVPALIISARYMALDERLEGGANNPNALGSRTALSFIVWVCLLMIVHRRWKWIVFPIMIIISLRVIMLTGSRGAAVTALISAAAASWYVWRRGGHATKILFPIALLAVAVIIFALGRDLPIMRRLAGLPVALGIETGYTGSGQETSIARLLIAKQALGVFRDHPIFGAGYGTFRTYSQYIYTHTTPFELLYATGIVGTFLYYLVIVSSWLVLSKAKKLFAHIPDISRYADAGRILIITELVAGLSLPTHLFKDQGIVSGIWLGTMWLMRSRMKEQLEADVPAELPLPA
jgi:hypothetical protein